MRTGVALLFLCGAAAADFESVFETVFLAVARAPLSVLPAAAMQMAESVAGGGVAALLPHQCLETLDLRPEVGDAGLDALLARTGHRHHRVSSLLAS